MEAVPEVELRKECNGQKNVWQVSETFVAAINI
jgi:hypothetical protein